MKKQILSILMILNTLSVQAFPPVKDIALTSVAAIGTFGGGGLGYYLGSQDKMREPATVGDKIFATAFFSLFCTLVTAPFTIPYTSYYKFWKAKRTVNQMFLHELFLQYDLYQIKKMDLDRLFEILNTKWDAYPLASSFDFLSEWSKQIKEAIKLYNEVVYANETKTVECNDKIATLREINNILVSIRDRIQDSNKEEFDRQMKVFLKEKEIEQMRKLEQAQRMNAVAASANVHYVHHR